MRSDGDYGSRDIEADRELKALKRDDTRIKGIDYPIMQPQFIWENDIREDRIAGFS